ncbi:MAG: GreA/GreB family elongation factor [Lentisphaeria bacterium]|nr:GreA/GreB family elongation factor [Lentisphaeria bacterium]
MDKTAFDKLLSDIIDKPAKLLLDTLKKELQDNGPLSAELSAQLEILWEAWGNMEMDTACAEVCITAAEQGVADSPAFRKLLVVAVKTLLPNNLGNNPVMRSLGVRDEKVALPNVALRLRRLLALRTGAVIFQPSCGRWGAAGTIDPISGTIPVKKFRGIGSDANIPLEQILRDVVVLAQDIELDQLIVAGDVPVAAARFREIVARRARVAVTEEEMRAMALTGCARKLNSMAFEAYWNAKAPAAAAGKDGGRKSWQGRSILEIDVLLDTESKNGDDSVFDAAACEAFKAFFTKMRPEIAVKDGKKLAELLGKLAVRCEESVLCDMLSPLKVKTAFWPADPVRVALETLSVWGELPAKSTETLAKVTAMAFSEEYLAKCMLRVPLKALNAMGTLVSDEMIYDMIRDNKMLSADMLLWIWKNRKKRPGDELLSLVIVENVCRVLGGADVPKAWGPARRELRALLLDNADFQKHLLDAAGDNAMMFASVLQGALFLNASERQSLMVKLSRSSKVLQEYLESGAGQRILKADVGVTEEADAPEEIQPDFSSVLSQKRLAQELDDIINIHVPENREALKTARAHGDFRENSEFDAAKERRNQLSRRRSELERILALIQPVMMSPVTVSHTAVIGSVIDLEYADGTKETYSLLGAWDGDPDRGFLSYKTRLGAAVFNCKVGGSFKVGDREGKLVAVRALPAELIAELDA